MQAQTLAIPQTSVAQAAYESLINCAKLLVSALYGTQKRANITMVLAVLLCVAAFPLAKNQHNSQAFTVCAQ